jgi:hypothetical protein
LNLRALRYELIVPVIAAHRFRFVKTTGDGILRQSWSSRTATRGAMASTSPTGSKESPLPAASLVAKIKVATEDIGD